MKKQDRCNRDQPYFVQAWIGVPRVEDAIDMTTGTRIPASQPVPALANDAPLVSASHGLRRLRALRSGQSIPSSTRGTHDLSKSPTPLKIKTVPGPRSMVYGLRSIVYGPIVYGLILSDRSIICHFYSANIAKLRAGDDCLDRNAEAVVACGKLLPDVCEQRLVGKLHFAAQCVTE